MDLKVSAQTVLLIMVFWGQIHNYMTRVNLNLLVVGMVSPPSGTNGTSLEDLNETLKTSQHQSLSPKFPWNEWQRGLVLGSFNYGYCATQIIGGRLAELVGFKIVYGLSLLLSGLLAILTPVVVTNLPLEAFIGLRVVQGLLQGVTFPSCHAMTARWVEPYKRSSFVARSYIAISFGLVITFPICGALSHSYGWESAFYVTGALPILWFVAWWFLVFDSPDKHPRIDEEEKNTIMDSLEQADYHAEVRPVPWMDILKSKPFWGLMVADCTGTWGVFTLLNSIPLYIKEICICDLIMAP